jgi:endonuclease YncB( thermonuclease family)
MDSGGGSRPTTTQTVSGPALALDGDTVNVNGQRIDLWGVDAPNLVNSDGWHARAALDDLIGGTGTLICTIKDTSGTRDEAICSNSRAGDVGRAMLQGGWAIVSRSDTTKSKADSTLAGAYAKAELAARRQRAGLWGGMPRR